MPLTKDYTLLCGIIGVLIRDGVVTGKTITPALSRLRAALLMEAISPN